MHDAVRTRVASMTSPAACGPQLARKQERTKERTHDPRNFRTKEREGRLHDDRPEAKELPLRTPDAEVGVREGLCLPVSEPYYPIDSGRSVRQLRNEDKRTLLLTLHETLRGR